MDEATRFNFESKLSSALELEWERQQRHIVSFEKCVVLLPESREALVRVESSMKDDALSMLLNEIRMENTLLLQSWSILSREMAEEENNVSGGVDLRSTEDTPQSIVAASSLAVVSDLVLAPMGLSVNDFGMLVGNDKPVDGRRDKRVDVGIVHSQGTSTDYVPLDSATCSMTPIDIASTIRSTPVIRDSPSLWIDSSSKTKPLNREKVESHSSSLLSSRVDANAVRISLRPSTIGGPLDEALPTTSRCHLHPLLVKGLTTSLSSALQSSNAFFAYLTNAISVCTPPSALSSVEPQSLRELVGIVANGVSFGIVNDPLRMVAPIAHMHEGSLTLGFLLVSDSTINIVRDGQDISSNRRHLLIPKATIRKIQVGPTLAGEKTAPPLSDAIPPPALHIFLSHTATPLAHQQQLYRTVVIQHTSPHRNKSGVFADNAQVIIFETESDMMRFLSIVDLDANGARASPFSPFYCPSLQLQKHFGDFGWKKHWGGTGFGEFSWLAEGANSMADLAAFGGAETSATAISAAKGAARVGAVTASMIYGEASAHNTRLVEKSLLPLPKRQLSFSKPALLRHSQAVLPSQAHLSPIEQQFCGAHHILPRSFLTVKSRFLQDTATGTWFSMLDVAAYLQPANGRHLNLRHARVVVEFWQHFSRQIEAVELVEVLPPSKLTEID